MKEKLIQKLVQLLPKSIVYFATIRLWAHATTGKYGDTEAPKLTVADALERWAL